MKKNWYAKVQCTVIKQVHLSECTEEEASDENGMWDFADDEVEVEQVDWELLDLEEEK